MAVERKFITEGVRKARVEKYLSKELKRAGYGGMDIARTPLGTQVTIFAEKPGIVIGKGGKLVHQLTQDLAQNYGVESPQIEVQQVNNPSFNAQIMAELDCVLEGIEGDAEVSAIILTGAGSAFSAGIDLKDFDSFRLGEQDPSFTGLFAGQETFMALAEAKKPTIAAVNGFAVTGALELVISCDIIIAAQSARFADTHARVGIVPGAGMSSRLFQEVREKRGLAYAVYSFIAAHVDTGMFGVYLAVSPGQALEAVELVVAELLKLTREPVDAAELKGAAEYTKGSLLLASESADTQMVRAAQNEIYFGADIPLAAVIDRIESTTREDLLQLANDLFRRDRMVLTLLGPVDTPKESFEMCLASNA
mgnify:CR=1 FL=1